jgi:hypothetical protein
MTTENDNIETEVNEKKQKPKPHQSYSSKDEINENNCKFTDGEMLKFIRVRFPGHARSYPFLIGQRSLKYGQKVVAMSDRGMAVGYVNSFPYEIPFEKNLLPLKVLIKLHLKMIFKKKKKLIRNKKKLKQFVRT